MPKNDGEDTADDLFESVSRLADRYKLEGKDRRKFVHEHMVQGGYRAEPTYVKDDDDDGDGDGGKDEGSRYFGSRGRESGRDGGRDRDGGGGKTSGKKPRSSSDDDWYS
jgi:hypothetical protein